ncbi:MULTISPECIES: MFS transporter [unclassified Bradyrhizobium]|uniref:MFS transporter n=1 Tax=unclassified Bradyrhizobium TaxID=2631580 RepID=UPI0024E137EB|nr:MULTISPECIES: MFS transporter [unclassified Bradyrhizobium]
MTDTSAAPMMPAAMATVSHGPSAIRRSLVIGLTAFLTVVDLFATQAILPALTRHYGVTPAAMGFAVNACTIGMAIASLVVGIFSPRINRRVGILLSLVLLAVPTSLLAVAPGLMTFTALRILQGLCMASAFALTLAHLGEQCSAADAGSAFAAYITGNVASNLVGRLIATAVVDGLGLAWNFLLFAALNLAGAVLVYVTIRGAAPNIAGGPGDSPWKALAAHWRKPRLRASFGIGFCILFAFIGTFTFVNFVLVQPPLSLGMMTLGVVYFVFAPSVVTTLLAGPVAIRLGTRATLWAALALAASGLPLLLTAHLALVLGGMVLVAVGTFFAQAAVTGFVGRTASENRGIASGSYLACYFFGGLAGSALLGQLFDRHGWTACVAGIALALGMAAALVSWLKE